MIDLEELENQIREKQKSIRYDIRSFSIHMIINEFRNGEFYIPNYQRGFVWNKQKQSMFIESMIIGLPTSTLFIAQTDDGRLEIIDGTQRIKTIEKYVNGDLYLTKINEIPALNKTTYFDLSRSQQQKFLNRSLNVITLSPETTFEARLEIFSRMNTGGQARTSHEMRLAKLDEHLSHFIRDLSNFPIFNDILGFSRYMKNRREHEELVFRFFALSDDLKKYRGNMTSFLNKYATDLNLHFNENIMRNEFERTCVFIEKYFREVFLNRKTRINRTIFDSLFVGVNLALRENNNIIPISTSWIFESDFDIYTRVHAAQTYKRVKERIIYVKDRLLQGA